MYLRKGHSSVYLQYPTTGESMGAEMFKTDVEEETLTFKFKVKPVDSNQKSDEAHLHEMELSSVTIDDELIISKFMGVLNSNKITALRLEIRSRGKSLLFNAAHGPAGLNSFTFNIESKIS